MAIGLCLRAYLAIERAMIDLEDDGNQLAEHLRDSMDAVWECLSDVERRSLNARFGEPQYFAGATGMLQLSANVRRDTAVRNLVRAHFARAA
jgi:hypothetical protein